MEVMKLLVQIVPTGPPNFRGFLFLRSLQQSVVLRSIFFLLVLKKFRNE